MSRRRELLSAFTGMLSAIDRNHCPPSNGMPVRHHRNTQSEVEIPELAAQLAVESSAFVVLRVHAGGNEH
jgi:hypothetical protein